MTALQETKRGCKATLQLTTRARQMQPICAHPHVNADLKRVNRRSCCLNATPGYLRDLKKSRKMVADWVARMPP